MNSVRAIEFFCSFRANVTCLIAAINDAKWNAGEVIPSLSSPVDLTSLQLADNMTDGPNGLPVITSSVRIQILRRRSSNCYRARSGCAALSHFCGFCQRRIEPGRRDSTKEVSLFVVGSAIFNRGITSLQDGALLKRSSWDRRTDAATSLGTLNVLLKHKVTHKLGGAHEGGGIGRPSRRQGSSFRGWYRLSLQRSRTPARASIANQEGSRCEEQCDHFLTKAASLATGGGIFSAGICSDR